MKSGGKTLKVLRGTKLRGTVTLSKSQLEQLRMDIKTKRILACKPPTKSLDEMGKCKAAFIKLLYKGSRKKTEKGKSGNSVFRGRAPNILRMRFGQVQSYLPKVKAVLASVRKQPAPTPPPTPTPTPSPTPTPTPSPTTPPTPARVQDEKALLARVKQTVPMQSVKIPTTLTWDKVPTKAKEQFKKVLAWAIKQEGLEAKFPTVDDALAQKVYAAAGYGNPLQSTPPSTTVSPPVTPVSPPVTPAGKCGMPGFTPQFPCKGKTTAFPRLVELSFAIGAGATGMGTAQGHEGAQDMNLNSGGDPKNLIWHVALGSSLFRLGESSWTIGAGFSFTQLKFGPRQGTVEGSKDPGATYRNYVPSIELHRGLSDSGRWNFRGALGLQITEVLNGDFGDLGIKPKFLLYGPRVELELVVRHTLNKAGGTPWGIRAGLGVYGAMLFTTEVGKEIGRNTDGGRGFGIGVFFNLGIYFSLNKPSGNTTSGSGSTTSGSVI